MRLVTILLSYLILTILDGVFTFMLLKKLKQKGKEGNAFMRLFVKSPRKFFAVKVGAIIAIGVILYFYHVEPGRTWSIVGCYFFFALPVVWSLIGLAGK